MKQNNQNTRDITFTIMEAAALLKIGKSSMFDLLKKEEIRVVHLGDRIRRISAIELERFWRSKGGTSLFDSSN